MIVEAQSGCKRGSAGCRHDTWLLMWVNKTRLPHVLPPSAYSSRTFFDREIDKIFAPGWHLVATNHELQRHGDFVTRDLWGTPVIARRHDERLVAFVNVCAHRHARLVHEKCGSAERLRCRYHGWEYDGADGEVCVIPDASSFVPLGRKGGRERLKSLRVEMLGGLVFVSLENTGPSLREHLGEETSRMIERFFHADLRLVHAGEVEHSCNWKIPIENVLETYHVPFVHQNPLARHPEWFKVFSGKRSGDREIVHQLRERFTSYEDSLGAESRFYRAAMQLLHPAATTDYVHHHAFPNVVFGYTSIARFVQVIEPIDRASSRASIRLFFDFGQAAPTFLVRAVEPALRLVASRLIELVLREDAAVYVDVQRGMEASPHAGVLGCREERVHAFQAYVANACA